jgi:hypothetical protein
MHQIKKGNQWYHRYAAGFAYGMKVVYTDADYQDIAKRPEMAEKTAGVTPTQWTEIRASRWRVYGQRCTAACDQSG